MTQSPYVPGFAQYLHTAFRVTLDHATAIADFYLNADAPEENAPLGVAVLPIELTVGNRREVHNWAHLANLDGTHTPLSKVYLDWKRAEKRAKQP